MESLNFHLFEIVQQALLWINLALNPLGPISISVMQIIVFWLIVLFGIQYNISDSPIDKYGFQDIYQKDNLTLYENQYSLPISFASQSVYNDIKFTEHTLDNQASFLNQLADVNFDYFSPIPYEKTENTDDLISVTSYSNEDAEIQYQIEVPENSQVYLSFINLHFSNDKQKKS